MTRLVTPVEIWSLQVQAAMVLAESSAVISMRTLGMFGFWSVPNSENSRMISEKVYAATRAATLASVAAMSGARPDQITTAALKPIRQKTRANARRLVKRGPSSKGGPRKA